MIWIKISIIVLGYISTSIVAGYGEAYRIKDNEKYSQLWHDFQWLERIGITLCGVASGYLLKGWLLSAMLSLFGVIFFIIYDGLINRIAFKRNFFYVSETSKAFTEKYAHWWIKIPLLVLVFVLNTYFVRNKQGEKK